MDWEVINGIKNMVNSAVSNVKWYQPEETPRLVFAVASYSLPPTATAISQLQLTFEELIAPLTKARADITLHAALCKVGTDHWHRFEPNTLSWERMVDDFPVQMTILLDSELNRDRHRPPDVAILATNIREDPAQAHTIEAHISIDDLLNGCASPDYQAKLVDRVIQLYRAFNSVNGFITIDSNMTASCVGLITPYERAMWIPYHRAAPTFREKLRGYFWGNFLSRQHVDLLSGDSALRTAPVELVEEIADGSYYLQLSKDIHAVDNAQLQKLGAFLRPVLPQKRG